LAADDGLKRKRYGLNSLWAGLFFAFLALGLLWHPLIHGLSLVPWQISLMIDNVYSHGARAILNKYPNNPIMYDVAFQFFPWSAYTLHRIGAWGIPLWNPYVMAGLPFLANHQSSIFELTKLLGYALGISAIWLPNFSWWLTIALAGLFTFFFLRQQELSFTASIIGGTSFALSGPMIVWLGWPHSSTALWLPFLLLATGEVIATRRMIWIGVLAIGIAFLFFAGHLQIAWFVAFTCLLWAVWRIFVMRDAWEAPADPRSPYRPPVWLGLTVAGILGLGLASIQLGPTLELMHQSSTMNTGRGLAEGMGISGAVQNGRLLDPDGYQGAPEALLSLGLFVYPDLFGNARTGYFRPSGNTNESAVYIGIIGLALALSGMLFSRRDRRQAIFWFILALVFMGSALSVPGPALLNYLPIFNLANVGRVRFIVAFALSVLAAIGADSVFSNDSTVKSRSRSITFFAITTMLAVSVFLAVSYSGRLKNKVPTAGMLGTETYLLLALLAGCALILVLTLKPDRKKQVAARALLVVLIAGELLVYGSAYHGGIDPSLVADRRGALTWLQKEAGVNRITSFRKASDNRTSVFPNTSVILGLQDIRGYEVLNVNRFEQLQQLVGGKDSRTSYKTFSADFFNISGVRYFVQSARDAELAELKTRGLKQVYADQGTIILQNNAALPRAFVVYRTVRTLSAAKAARSFKRNKIDFSRQAIVEKGPALKGTGRLTPARITTYLPESVTLTLNAKHRGLLVLSDAYFPGWHASLDGKEAPIYPANVAFRGVAVPPGRHTIRFDYRPDPYRRAIYVFWLSLIGVILLIGAESYFLLTQ
jgi:hypothetical protein